MNILVSSDDSNSSVVRLPTLTGEKSQKEPELLTSDSEEEKIVFKKVKTPKRKLKEGKMLGEISLLTSDEEEGTNKKDTRKKRKKRETKKTQKVTTIELLSSDEADDDISSGNNKKDSRKRQLEGNDLTKDSTCSPPKKSKTIPSIKIKINRGKNYVAKKTSALKTASKSVGIQTQHNVPTTSATKTNVANQLLVTNAQNKEPDSSTGNGTSLLDDTSLNPAWEDFELLSERKQIHKEVARNLIRLWEDGNTIPFIARYRKNFIGDMSPEELRSTKEEYDAIASLKKKMCTVIKTVTQLGKLDNRLQSNICSARTVEELAHIYAPYKPESKRSLAERARQLGLEEPALHLLNNTGMVNFAEFVNPEFNDIKSIQDVEKAIMHLIASEMSTDNELMKFVRELRAKTFFKLQTKKARQMKSKEKVNESGQPSQNDGKNEGKFENYIDKDYLVTSLKPHQILAINRGEAQKVLAVKIIIPEFFEKQFKWFCHNKWTKKSTYDVKRKTILEMAINDAYNRLISPLITREIRAELKQKAEKESCKVFSENLKHLLLASPLKGKSILGIDPGFANGCKVALISSTGSVLAYNVVYPHSNQGRGRGEMLIRDMMAQHKCDLIAIGNGTACRNTERWISQLIESKFFGYLDVKYTIVNEVGASIYSCSPEAKKEFGNMDPNIISAVSLARRVQDPMAELVKVEPSHLGIGMYQLDIKKKQLEEALSEVISECVSFVGVDLNTASQCLLRRVAGLSDKRATLIIDYREKYGPFTYRRQLLKVFGIGERIFEQCAGFLRIGPTDPFDSDFYVRTEHATPLDATIIHPEAYPIVRGLLRKMELAEAAVGSAGFIADFKSKAPKFDVNALAGTFKTSKETIQLIFDALSKDLNHDLRSEMSGTPLFKRNITTFHDLVEGMILTGRVNNVTSFGAFMDVGVGVIGLLHNRRMNNITVRLGDKIEVNVTNIDRVKQHIQLEAIRKL